MSLTVFKIFLNSYLQSRHNTALLSDCLEAIKVPIHSFASKLQTQHEEVMKLFAEERIKMGMSVIQEETERQGDEGKEKHGIQQGFNDQIRILRKNEFILEEILTMYKTQLKQIAFIAQKNEEYQEKYKKLKEKMHNLKKIDKSKKNSISHEDEDIQEPKKIIPEPVKAYICQNCNQKNHQNKENSSFQVNKKKNDWKSLSLKIESLKKKIDLSQDQIGEKDSVIKQLTEKLHQYEKREKNQKEDEEKKKLKTANTTLRGQKVLMTNQINSFKKQILQKTEISEMQEIQIKKLRLQIENLSSTLKWHMATITDLKENYGKAINSDVNNHLQKISQLQHINFILIESLNDFQRSSEVHNAKIKQIESIWSKQIDQYQKKINDLEAVLEQKNQSIIKLKIGAKGIEKSNYHTEMIKVLNKKIAQKDERIRSLQSIISHQREQ